MPLPLTDLFGIFSGTLDWLTSMIPADSPAPLFLLFASSQQDEPSMGNPPCKRGIYQPRWLDECGCRLLIAVNSKGCKVWTARVWPHEDRSTIARMLRRLLDKVDPVVPSPPA